MSAVKCYFWLYSPKNWEFRMICQLVTCDDRRPCIDHHYSFSQKTALGRAGLYNYWLPFWSQFEQVHKDEDIAPEDKFQHLVQATVSGSRAREIVESFPPTGANYQKAIESLQSRFGREDILVEVYVI
ncbi:uncharacterized protein TNCV_4788801 [Trichonephila clavipes]|nr:uncharacterized protein TNCV_4788801 [Trichonephila clavipes]